MYYGRRNNVSVERLLQNVYSGEVLLHHDGRKKERARLLTSPINKASQYQEEYCLYKLSDVVVSVVLWCISCL